MFNIHDLKQGPRVIKAAADNIEALLPLEA
jgi:hypothetical protein